MSKYRYFDRGGDLCRMMGEEFGDILLTDHWNKGAINPVELLTYGMPMDEDEAATHIRSVGGDPDKLME